jgi:hypothetical protein
MTAKSILLFGSLLFLSMTPSYARAESFAVLELFTSQGCSSCPPADKVLRSYSSKAKRENLPIIALSYHVDYWNYLGWGDPYSKEWATKRQYDYSKAMRRRGVYTPQLVINGTTQLVGSKKEQVESAISNALIKSKKKNSRIKLENIELNSSIIKFLYKLENPPKGATLVFLLAEDKSANKVLSGENSGKTLSHTNVVRVLNLSDWNDSLSGEAALKVPGDLKKARASIVALIQDKLSMKIFAAWQTYL